MKRLSADQQLILILRIACAMCFIGHGAFGIITKAVWCNYFGVFGISEQTAYQLMPVVGIVDIAFGLLMLFYPIRGAFAWLVIWGMFTALLRPLSGEPLAEFFERAGNYGAPFVLLLAVMFGSKKESFSTTISSSVKLGQADYKKLFISLRVAAFLLMAGHAWLNLIAKKGLMAQYTLLGFSDPHLISQLVGSIELVAAFAILIKPSPKLVLALFFWKMTSELLYPSYELFEWVERGGSYGVLLALWLVAKQNAVTTTLNFKPILLGKRIKTYNL